MHIGLTYDLKSEYLAMGYSPEEAAEFDREETIDAIEKSLRAAGHGTERIGYIRNLAAMLSNGKKWDLVFNIAEGVSGFSREAQVPALLEAYQIPYCGSDPLTLALTHHKGFTKQIVALAGVPTPAFSVVTKPIDVGRVSLRYPLFVKPIAEGTGKGINGKSMVTNEIELKVQCEYVISTFKQPALVEEYLPGREITVGVLGSGRDAKIIGAMEIISLDGAEDNAYSYFNKENYEQVITYSLVNDEAVLREAEALCISAWDALGGKDFCRMDLRADEAGRFSFIEVNALPGLNPVHSDLPIICQKKGFNYAALINSVVNSARIRYGL